MKLILNERFREYSGEGYCVITETAAIIYDVYEDEGGQEVLVCANASHKIQNFVRDRQALHCTDPMEFVIYGKRVTVLDHRTSSHTDAPPCPDGEGTPPLCLLPGGRPCGEEGEITDLQVEDHAIALGGNP